MCAHAGVCLCVRESEREKARQRAGANAALCARAHGTMTSRFQTTIKLSANEVEVRLGGEGGGCRGENRENVHGAIGAQSAKKTEKCLNESCRLLRGKKI